MKTSSRKICARFSKLTTPSIPQVKRQKMEFEKQCVTKYLKANKLSNYVLNIEQSRCYSEYLNGNIYSTFLSIDNSNLLVANQLKPNLTFKRDFVFINKLIWDFLIQLYGGGPMIKTLNKQNVLT